METVNDDAYSLLKMLYAKVERFSNKSKYYICYDKNDKQQLYYGTKCLTDNTYIKDIKNGKSHLEYITTDKEFYIRDKNTDEVLFLLSDVSSVYKTNVYDDGFTVFNITQSDKTMSVVIVTNSKCKTALVKYINNIRSYNWNFGKRSYKQLIIESDNGKKITSDDIILNFIRKKKESCA